jgi:hypothetical protein
MKTQLFLISTLVSVAANAQDVKVKKDIITVNGKEIAKVDKQKEWYKISSLDDTAFVYIRTTNTTPNGFIAGKYWLEVKNENEAISEFTFQDVPFSLSREKLAIQSFIKANTGILSETEFNKEAIKTVFENANREISTKHDEYRAEILAINEEEDRLADASKLSINYNNGNITINGIVYGYVVKKKLNPSTDYFQYSVVDTYKREIGTIIFYGSRASNKKLIVTTIDKKEYELDLIKSNFNNLDYNDLSKRLVHKLHAQGYDLSRINEKLEEIKKQINEEKQNQYNDKIQEVKNASLNVYDVPGYIIDKKGVKKEGKITMEFENLDSKTSSPSSGIMSVGSYGSTGRIVLTNGKSESFKAKDGVEFGYADIKYLGLPTTEDSGLNNGNSELDVFGGSTKFLKVVYENNGNYILTHVKTPNDYYLKLDKEKKAIYLGNKGTFGKKSDEKIKKNFDTYIGCSTLDVVNYDTNTKEGLIQVITDFLATCN